MALTGSTAAETFGAVLLAPARGLAAAAARASFVAPLVAATLASLAVAAVLAPRLAYAPRLDRQIEAGAHRGEPAPSPFEREVKIERARKLGTAALFATALLAPVARALAVALCAWIAFRVAGARPGWRGVLAASSWGLLPLAIADVLSLPALARLRDVAAGDPVHVLPSSLAAALGPDAPPRAVAIAAELDLFSLWALALVTLGLAAVAGVSRVRAWAVSLTVWSSYVLLASIVRPGGTP